MKFILLFVGIAGIVPLSFVLSSSPTLLRLFWIAIGLFPFLSVSILKADVAIISWESWHGHVYGLELSIIDLLAVAIYIVIFHNVNSIRFHIPFLLYFLAISASILQAEMPLAATFYVWQFVRIYFLVFVVAKACTDYDVAAAILKGLTIGLMIQMPVLFWQLFVLHVNQPSGTFGHQNTLGIVTHFINIPQLVLLLAGQRTLWTTLTPLLGTVVVVLTASRATVAFSALGFVAALSLSSLRKLTPWKALVAGVGILFVAAIVPVAVSAFQKRFESNPLTEDLYDERAAHIRTALLILEDHPFGVGANHYAFIAQNGYAQRGGVVEANVSMLVHNVYLLAAAETGYVGLLAFALMLLFPVYIAFRYARRTPSKRGDLLFGLGVALIMVYLHSMVEFILISKEVQYILALVFGMIFGLAHNIKAETSLPPPIARRSQDLNAGWRLR
jgi:O-antigen ligase